MRTNTYFDLPVPVRDEFEALRAELAKNLKSSTTTTTTLTGTSATVDTLKVNLTSTLTGAVTCAATLAVTGVTTLTGALNGAAISGSTVSGDGFKVTAAIGAAPALYHTVNTTTGVAWPVTGTIALVANNIEVLRGDTVGNLTVAKALILGSLVSPPQITANQNDYNPTGLATAGVLRVTTDAARTLTGLSAPTAATRLYLVNIGAFTLTLSHEDALSAAANRFTLPGAVNRGVTSGGGAVLWYDTISTRWRVVDI